MPLCNRNNNYGSHGNAIIHRGSQQIINRNRDNTQHNLNTNVKNFSAIFSYPVTVGSKGGTWAVTVIMWDVAASMWAVTASVWTGTAAMLAMQQ